MTDRYFDLRSTVLVVVGHAVLAEEEGDVKDGLLERFPSLLAALTSGDRAAECSCR